MSQASSLGSLIRIKDLRERILFTIGVLIVYRIGTTIPIPGINVNALKTYFLLQEASSRIGISDYLDFFAGGAFSRFSIFMLGILPYISMSIIMQLMLLVFPRLKRISEEDGGRKKIRALHALWHGCGVRNSGGYRYLLCRQYSGRYHLAPWAVRGYLNTLGYHRDGVLDVAGGADK